MGPIDSPFGRVELIGEADPMENPKPRKPNLATFGPIIYYISSRIQKNHHVESRKDLITLKKYGIRGKIEIFSGYLQQEY